MKWNIFCHPVNSRTRNNFTERGKREKVMESGAERKNETHRENMDYIYP